MPSPLSLTGGTAPVVRVVRSANGVRVIRAGGVAGASAAQQFYDAGLSEQPTVPGMLDAILGAIADFGDFGRITDVASAAPFFDFGRITE